MNRPKILVTGLAVASLTVGALAAFPAGGASAAHCVSSDGASPGFSWFGAHVQFATHHEGGNPGPHAGTSGASNCLETSGNPSERAPGRN